MVARMKAFARSDLDGGWRGVVLRLLRWQMVLKCKAADPECELPSYMCRETFS